MDDFIIEYSRWKLKSAHTVSLCFGFNQFTRGNTFCNSIVYIRIENINEDSFPVKIGCFLDWRCTRDRTANKYKHLTSSDSHQLFSGITCNSYGHSERGDFGTLSRPRALAERIYHFGHSLIYSSFILPCLTIPLGLTFLARVLPLYLRISSIAAEIQFRCIVLLYYSFPLFLLSFSVSATDDVLQPLTGSAPHHNNECLWWRLLDGSP